MSVSVELGMYRQAVEAESNPGLIDLELLWMKHMRIVPTRPKGKVERRAAAESLAWDRQDSAHAHACLEAGVLKRH